MRILSSVLSAAAVAASLSAGDASAADVTCARTSYSGLICLTAAGITKYGRKNSPLTFRRATDLTACGDKIAVLGYRKVYLFDGKNWSKPIDIVGKFGRRIACGPKGEIWVLGPKSVSSFNGSDWKVHSRKQMFGEDTTKAGFMGSVAVGPGGKALVLGSRMAAMYDGKTWRVYKAGKGIAKRTFLSKAYFDAKGVPWIAGIRGLLTLKGDNWVTVPGPRGTTFLTGGPDGVLWVGGGRSLFKMANGRISRMQINSSMRSGSVDNKGRLWLATNFGLMLRTGDKWDARQMHNSDLPDNSITKVVTLGAGGVLPPSKDQPAGSIMGRMQWSDGKEIAGARMELCGSPSWFIRRDSSPCAGKPLSYQAKTDDKGRFEIKKIMPAIYRIAIKPEGNTRWVLISLGRRGQVLPGQSKNTGTIRLSVRNRK
jgi:hypothetical protein